MKELPLKPSHKFLKQGLQNPHAILFLGLWYIFSAGTLFLNKYILSYQKDDPYFLCGMQMLITMICGFIQLKYPLGTYKPVTGQRKPPKFYANMILLGLLQLGTILFGLIALYFVAVSFAETVKSSAPIFTVFIARYFLGEKTSPYVFLSLFPVMIGLALCSVHELSFNLVGFLCAMATNLSECIQSVVSKSLLSDKSYFYSPAQLQFYPNMAAVFIQCSIWYFFVDFTKLYSDLSGHLLIAVVLDGISFHGQTITAYVLMSHISPVTYSVANTTKRAFLIWLSVLLFNNSVTFYSGLGTVIVIIGVLLYGKARDIDARIRMQFSITEDSLMDLHRFWVPLIHELMDEYSPFYDGGVMVGIHSLSPSQRAFSGIRKLPAMLRHYLQQILQLLLVFGVAAAVLLDEGHSSLTVVIHNPEVFYNPKRRTVP